MSAGAAVSTSRSAPPGEAPAPAPLIAPTGNPSLDAVADVVNATAEPFHDVMDPELGTAQRVAAGLNAAMGIVGVVPDLVDTGFAVLTAPLAKLFPALPAITLGGLHVGPPHTHTHPPSLTPPAPTPVPLPSIGVVLGAGAVTVFLGGLPAARCGDIGISVTCGSLAPPFEIATGSSNVFIGGARAARMGDLTKHCNPTSAGKPGAFDLIMNAAAAAAGALDSNAGAVAQAAAETAMLGVKALMGKDPGLPMLPGALLGPPVPNVLIGGFPCPALGDMAMGKLLGGLKKALPKGKKKGGERKHGDPLDGSNAAQREANGVKCNGSHPIYLVTGENFDSYLDFASDGLFEWRRHYTSARNTTGGPLGCGWRHSYQMTLRRRLHRATFVDWDGLRTEFGPFPLGSTATRANGYVLERLGPGHFRVRRRGQPHLEFRGGEFDDELRLTRVERDGAALDLSYDPLGRLTALEEARADGHRRFELELDGHGRIRRLWQLDLSPDARPAEQRIRRAAYRYSGAGDLELALDSLEGQARYEYDAFHRLTLQSDARGYAYRYRYDAQGRCVRASGHDGLWWCRVQYFPEQRFTRYTEGDNATWEYHYDGAGVVTQIVDPHGGKLSRRLDHLGRMASEIDAGGREIRWLYDADGAHIGREDRFGHRFAPERDQPRLPNPFARELPRTCLGWLFAGAIEPEPSALFGVDPAELAALPEELQSFARGCFRTANGAPGTRRPALRIERDALGRKLLEQDAVGRRREWRYDATGNLVASIDRDGRRRTQETTSWNLTGARIDPLGNAVRYEYSKIEQIVAITDPLGNVSRYDYDQKGRLVRVYRNGNTKDQYLYDEGDHFIEKRDGQGRVLFTNSIHPNHFVAKRQLASGGEHRFDYDERGRIIEASTEAHEVRLAYDAFGRRIADYRDGAGVEHEYGAECRFTKVLGAAEYRVRRQGSVTAIEHAGSGVTSIERRGSGLVVRRASNGTTELLQFDEEGRLEASLRYRVGRHTLPECTATRYAYGAGGDLLQVSDSRSGTAQFEVDDAHRLVAEGTNRGHSFRYVHDAANNLIGTSSGQRASVVAGNHLSRTESETFAYDTRSNLSERAHRDGATTRYSYDSVDMLVRVERSDGTGALSTWTATYDAMGRRVQSGHPGATRNFYWDGDRLAAETLPGGQLRIYEYASQSALVPCSFTEQRGGAEPGQAYHVFSNPVGMPLCIEDDSGRVVWHAGRIDPYGEIAIEGGRSGALEYNLRWPGHYFDPETGLHYNRHRYYDPKLGRYLQSDPLGHAGSSVNLYAYCPNPLVQVDVLGLDHENQANASNGTGEPGFPHQEQLPTGVLPLGRPLRRDEGQALVDAIHEARALEPSNPDDPNSALRFLGQTRNTTTITQLQSGILVVTNSTRVSPRQREVARYLLESRGFTVWFTDERGSPGYVLPDQRRMRDPATGLPLPNGHHGEPRGIRAGEHYGDPAARQWSSNGIPERADAHWGGSPCSGCEAVQQGQVVNETGDASGRYDDGITMSPGDYLQWLEKYPWKGL